MTTLADIGMFRGARSRVRGCRCHCPSCGGQPHWQGDALVCDGCGWTGKSAGELARGVEDNASGRYMGR